MKMIKVIRYSIHGFKPQKQDYHLGLFVYPELYHYDEFLRTYQDQYEYMKHILEERHNILVKFYEENLNDFQRGIWVFKDGHKNNRSLNHLKSRVPCFEAYLPSDTEVYNVNWDRKILLSDDLVECFGCYVPERSLNGLSGVRKR